MLSQQQLIKICLILLMVFVIESATDEKPNLQRYFPLVTDEQLLNNDKRFQQIMQGSSSSSDAIWPDKHKFEKVDVKKEINKLNNTYVYQAAWPALNFKLGSVTAVTFDKAGNVVIFHRCDRVWEQDSFSLNNVYTKQNEGPILESTVLGLDRETGKLVYDWGKRLFYMPHGLTIDHKDNVWATDVARHQVFKFGSQGSRDMPLMILGTAFTPGAGKSKFCKPTSVAVLKNGDFFVADGYCNARILKYTRSGDLILQWGQNTFSGLSFGVAPQNFFAIPHALTLVPEQELICAADRENGRIQCFYWSNCTFHSQYHSQIIGDRLFSMDYTPADEGQFVVVNGPTAELGSKTEQYNEVRGYVMDFNTKKVTSKFGPNDMEFHNPHDVAVSMDGIEVYVAELNPMRIHKFLHKSVVQSVPLSNAKPTANVEAEVSKDKTGILTSQVKPNALSMANSPQYSDAIEVSSEGHHRPGATAILVASLMLLFAFLTFGLALLIARKRKRGCMPFGSNNRRHAWDFPSKPDGLKLGGLLMERNKRSGFEMLDQNASDEETEKVTNNTLTSAKFG